MGPPIPSLPEPCLLGVAGVRGGTFDDPVEKGGAWNTPGAGLGGTDPEGEGASTIHMRCERVAHNLATVCASVLKGVT